MKTNYSLAAMLFCSVVFGQTTLTKAANDYVFGDTVTEFNLTGIPDNSATGTGAIFNNTSLMQGAAITGTVSAPSAAEGTSYPGTTVKFSDGNGNDVFYKSTATDLQITGATVGGAVLNFSTDNAVFLKWPMAFSESTTDTASGIGVYTGVTAYFLGTITSTADAAGTLQIGTQSIPNIIRLKTVQNYNLYFDAAHTFNIGNLTSTIYTYYDNSNRYPLFTSTTAHVVAPIANIDQTISTAIGQANLFLGVRDLSAKSKIQAYPNPTENQLFFAGDLSGFSEVKIYNLEGRLVKTLSIKDEKININTLPAGNYILQLSGKYKKAQNINIIKK